MNRNEANKFLAKIDADLFVNKAEGVWYLLGGDDNKYDPYVERCLHVVRASDLTEDVLKWKIEELMEK